MRNSKQSVPAAFAISFLLLSVHACASPLKVVASTADLAAVAREIGGDLVEVQSLCSANQDPHEFEILPQHVIAVRHADVYLKVGAGLDYWSDELLSSSENPRRLVVDCSQGITLIRDAGGSEHAHHHPEHELGNPHYWLAPSNTLSVADNILRAFRRADSLHTETYTNNSVSFVARFESATQRWTAAMSDCSGQRMVTYHRAWDYFARDFGMEITGTVEPQPGAEPSSANLATLENQIRRQHAKILVLEPFESDRYARLLEHDTGISIINAPSSVGGAPGTDTIIEWFDFLVREFGSHCATVHP